MYSDMTTPRIVMMGTGTLPTGPGGPIGEAYPVVGLVTEPDRNPGVSPAQPPDRAGHEENCPGTWSPVLQPESINTPEGVAGLKPLQPELLIVAAYGQILNREVLELSAWGGSMSMLRCCRDIGERAQLPRRSSAARQDRLTIIRMSTALTPATCSPTPRIDIGPGETAGELGVSAGSSQEANLAVHIAAQIVAGPVPGEKQDPAKVTKAPKLKKEDGLIDWSNRRNKSCGRCGPCSRGRPRIHTCVTPTKRYG